MKYIDEIKKGFNELKNKETRKRQIPNLITTTRLLASFVIIPIMLTNTLVGIIYSTIIASTDFIDGYIAKKYNLQSELGRYLDVVSDKLFALSLIIPLLILNPTVLPFISLNLLLEGVISVINVISEKKENTPKTKQVGRIKTILLSLTLIMGYVTIIANLNPLIEIILSLITSLNQGLAIGTYSKDYLIKEHEKKELEQTKEVISDPINETESEKRIRLLKEYKNDFLKEEKSKTLVLKKRGLK